MGFLYYSICVILFCEYSKHTPTLQISYFHQNWPWIWPKLLGFLYTPLETWCPNYSGPGKIDLDGLRVFSMFDLRWPQFGLYPKQNTIGLMYSSRGTYPHSMYLIRPDRLYLTHDYKRKRPEKPHFNEFPGFLQKLNPDLRQNLKRSPLETHAHTPNLSLAWLGNIPFEHGG